MTSLAGLSRATDFFIPEADVVLWAGRLGAEIRNVRLLGDPPDAVIDAIHQLLLRHKVVFFRGQDHLDDDEQERFACRLGGLVPHPFEDVFTGTIYETEHPVMQVHPETGEPALKVAKPGRAGAA